MHPVLLNLPFGISVKSYGLMMMLGFFAATWWAMYRANKVKADPDVILNLGFVALISGIVGARLFYVLQFWEKDFAHQPNPLLAALNVTAGGLVFYGGFLLAVLAALVYLIWARHSIRLYLDILAPSLMVGLAFGRMGCFLNGCCWGAPTEKVQCSSVLYRSIYALAGAPQDRLPWAVRFPFGWESTPFMSHWEKGLLNVPVQLLYHPQGYALPVPIQREHIGMSAETLQGPQQKVDKAKEALEQARKSNASAETIAALQNDVTAAKSRADEQRKEYADLAYAYEHYGLTPSDVTALASHYTSLPVHPTQLYAVIDALLIAALLHAIFMRRRQQGMCFGLLFIFYGIGRFIEEMIRGDNPTDWHLAGMDVTMSQAISIYTFLFAVVYLIVLYRLPATPPAALRTVPAEAQETPGGKPATA
jgi:phosphatidylglycerol:prolipoprotein diacylglycerol transferase